MVSRRDAASRRRGDKLIRIVSSDGTVVCQLEGHAGHVGAMAWAPSGQQLVSAATDKSLLVWDVETGRQTASFPVQTEVSALGWKVVGECRPSPAVW